MSLVTLSVRRPVAVGMLVVAVAIFGAVSFTRLPVNLLPEISYPTLTIETKYAGAAPSEVESLITRPVEESVGVISGVQRLTSRSRSGLSQVTLEFAWKTNMDLATLDAREKLDLVTLPRDAQKPAILRFDPSSDPILRLGLSGAGDLAAVRRIAEDVVKKDLESIDGLASVKVEGGLERQIEVRVDESRLASVGLTVQDVLTALARNNVNLAGGSIYEHEARYLVRTLNEFQNVDDVAKTIVRDLGGRQVMLHDVAEVGWGHKDREVVARINGQESVSLNVYKEGDANTVAVARAVKARLQRIQKTLPAGMTLATVFDQSTFIEGAISEVVNNGWQGGLLAILVIFFFLREARSTAVIALSIPISVVATFIIMHQMGLSLNIMSLGGLALGIGLLVDDSIVVLEVIARHREAGKSVFQSAIDGTREVQGAVVASTLTTVAVFLPIVFVEGVGGQLFKDQALTVSFSILASLVISLTLIPMLTAKFGTAEPVAPLAVPEGRMARSRHFVFYTAPVAILRGLRRAIAWAVMPVGWILWPMLWVFERVETIVYRMYPRMIAGALRRPWLVLGTAALLFALSMAGVSRLGVELIPPMSQGEFSFEVKLPEGTPIESTDRVLADLARRAKQVPGVDNVFSTAGGGRGGADQGSRAENVGELLVLMRNRNDKVAEESGIGQIRRTLAQFPDATATFSRPSFFTFRTPVELELYGDDYENLRRVAGQTVARLQTIHGLADLTSSADAGSPEVRIRFKPDQLARLDLTPESVSQTLRTKVKGEVATRISEGDREIDVIVRAADASRDEVADVVGMIVQRRGGVAIPLRAVASAELATGPSEIRRVGQRRAVVISGNLQGRDLGSVTADIERTVAAAGLPAWVTAKMGGQNLEISTSFRSLYLAIGLAVFLVYFVMAAQFESLLHPLIIMFSIPMGAVGVVAALVATGHRVSVIVLIGVVMLAGIVVKNAIVLIDHVNQRRRGGLSTHDALIEAGRVRLRPILMTTATAILGLIPMALGLGEGAEIRAPMAVTVIGGLAVSTVLTLIVIPTMYFVLDRRTLAPAVAGEE
ncbi:MAG: efflux RND transporter permease subunit [Acidobacteriota bacterium]